MRQLSRRRFLGFLAAAPVAVVLPAPPVVAPPNPWMAKGGFVYPRQVPAFRIFVPRTLYNAALPKMNEMERKIFVSVDQMPMRAGKTLLTKHFKKIHKRTTP
jgi:hypothetical protein